LAIGFYAAEVLIVHLQFRKDAHTFSVSEIPMLLGVLYAAPIDVLIGQFVGALVALVIHRRQRFAKLAFNLGQLLIQCVAAVVVFRWVHPMPTFDLVTVAAAMAAMLVALFVGHLAVGSAILATGGRENLTESLKVLAVSSSGTVGASLLGLVAAVVISETPSIAPLGFVPVALLFVAYRAYIAQSRDKGRVTALFDAATALHRSPQIERAVAAAGSWAVELVQAELAKVVILSQSDEGTHYVTTISGLNQSTVMAPITDGTEAATLRRISASTGAGVMNRSTIEALRAATGEQHPLKDGIAVTLAVGGEPVGMLTAFNRIGDVSAFGHDDVRVLATLGSQLSTTLENGRLSENLAEVTRLQHELEALLESKDRLVASVSHELRTPLTGVIGLTSMIREEAADRLEPETAAMLDLVVEQGNELSNIIEDLLAHARFAAGTLTVRPEPFDVLKEVRTVTASQGPPVKLESAGEATWAVGDALRFRQILRNLITNARRYGGPTIRVRVTAVADRIEVAVVDDGKGVPAGQEASIFEPYQSAHDQTGQPGSVGLGLAVSRSIARMMDGDLTYRRRLGHTLFTLDLPRLPEIASHTPSLRRV
jgi:signal transduction histidine kinase